MAISGLFLADILWLNLLPTATAAIGWKYYLVFVSLAVAHTIYMALFLPDVSSRFSHASIQTMYCVIACEVGQQKSNCVRRPVGGI